MKKLFSLCMFLLAFSFQINAQVFQWANSQPGNDYSIGVAGGRNLVATTGGFLNSITIGNQSFNRNNSNNNYLAVHDHHGQFRWAKHLVFSPAIPNLPSNLLIDQNKNVIISGMLLDSLFIDSLIFRKDPNHSNAYFVVKFD